MDCLVDRGHHQLGHRRASQGLHSGWEDVSDMEETAGYREGDSLYTNTVLSQTELYQYIFQIFLKIFLTGDCVLPSSSAMFSSRTDLASEM